MESFVWESYSKYQRSWPLKKCKHEEKYEEERAFRLAELARQKATRAAEKERKRRWKLTEIDDEQSSTTTDPDRLSIRLDINDLMRERDPSIAEDQKEKEHNIASGHRIPQEGRNHGCYDNHARRALSNKGEQVVADKDQTAIRVSRLPQTDILFRKRRHTSKAKKRRPKKRGPWREYIWQNDYDLFHSQQKKGVNGKNSSDVKPEPLTAMEKLGSNSKSALIEYRQNTEGEYNRFVRRNAATLIQSAVRGWLTRHFIHKLMYKTSCMDMPWRTFARDYLKLMDAVRERNLTVRNRPSLNLLDMYKYTLKQEYFDEVFDSITRLILDKTSLAEFVKRCDIRVAPKDIEDSYRYVFKGVPKTSVSLVVDITTSGSSTQLQPPVGVAESITKKLSKVAFTKEVTVTTNPERHATNSNLDYSSENKDINDAKNLFLKINDVVKRQITILIIHEDNKGDFKRLYERQKQQGVPVFLIAVGKGELSELKYVIPSRRTYHITSNRMWNQNVDSILEDIFKQSKQCYPMPSGDNITTQLHRREAMEIVWTLQPPPGTGCPVRKKVVPIYSAQDLEAWSLTNQEGFNKMSLQ